MSLLHPRLGDGRKFISTMVYAEIGQWLRSQTRSNACRLDTRHISELLSGFFCAVLFPHRDHRGRATSDVHAATTVCLVTGALLGADAHRIVSSYAWLNDSPTTRRMTGYMG
jgi:hypothetical protein